MFRSILTLVAFASIGLVSARADDSAKDVEALKGTWKVIKAKGGPAEKDVDKGLITLVFTADTITVKKGDGQEPEVKFKLDGSKSPKQIDILAGSKTIKGIYEVKGDTLRLCFDREGERPGSFDATGMDVTYLEATREKK